MLVCLMMFYVIINYGNKKNFVRTVASYISYCMSVLNVVKVDLTMQNTVTSAM